jgi:hypothetical protein
VQRTGVRTVPDVAYNSDSWNGQGVWVYDTPGGGFTGFIGTSAGAPQWAGLIAVANEGRHLAGLNPLDGASQTLPAIYSFSSAFRDITIGSNGYPATPGYDLATGLGSPYGVTLAGDLAFHVPGNYRPMALMAGASQSSTPYAGQTSNGASSLATLGISTIEGNHAARPTVHKNVVDTSSRPTVRITRIQVAAPTQGSPVDYHRVDRALGSLLNDEHGFLQS